MKPVASNYYQVLGLSPKASAADIRKAYLTYAVKFHPDKHAGDPFFEDRFKEVTTAYEFLSDTEKRWQYDIKTFGRSAVVVETQKQNFIPDTAAGTSKRFVFDIRHLDVYVAAFYFINVTAWVIVRKSDEHAYPGSYVWGLFIGSLSSLFFWLFIEGWIERNYRKSTLARLYWVAYAVLAMSLLGILFTL